MRVNTSTGGARGRRLFGVFLALALVAGACGGDDDGDGPATGEGDDDTETTEAASDPVPGGDLVIGVEAESDGLNPTANRFAVAGSWMGNSVFDTVGKFMPDGTVAMNLAESLTPNDDYTQWTIKLRPGVTFHDGTPLTSEAIQVGVEAQRSDPLIGIAVRPVVADPPVTIVDELTATINLSRAMPHFPGVMTTQLGMVASPTWLRAAAADPTLNQQPVGTGPFKFDSRSLNTSTRFVRNENYWREGLPYLDSITFVVATDAQVRAQNLSSGEFDVLHTSRDEDILAYRDDENVQLYEDEAGEETFLMMNTSTPPFDDVRVRRALAHATNRQEYVDLTGSGILTIANGMFHPDSRWYTELDNFPAFDLEEAASLITEYCADVPDQCDGDRVKFGYKTTPNPDNEEVFQTLSDMWGDIAAMERTPVEQTQIITDAALGNYQIVLWRQFGAGDPDQDMLWLDSESIGAISVNWPRIDDPEIDGWLDEQRVELDVDARRQDWANIGEQLNELVPYIWLNHTLWAVVAKDNVHGLGEQTAPGGEEIEGFNNGRAEITQAWMD
ncbi:MAG: ABC transporter substrate-binding protein [Actinomycetota bacterium]